MYEVRPLSFDSFEWAVNVAAKNMLEKEVQRPDFYDKPTIEKLASKMLVEGTGLIAYKKDRPVGAIGGIVHPNIYNPRILVLTELLWYVLPEFRQTRVGFQLLKAYRELADSVADEASLSTLTSSQINPSSLQKFGFELKESSYYYIRKDV